MKTVWPEIQYFLTVPGMGPQNVSTYIPECVIWCFAPQALAFTAGPEPKAEGTAVNRLSPLQVPLEKECILWNLHALCLGDLSP